MYFENALIDGQDLRDKFYEVHEEDKINKILSMQSGKHPFKLHMLNIFPWLQYDSQRKVAFCKICTKYNFIATFSKTTLGGSKSFKDKTPYFLHQQTKTHKKAEELEKAANLMKDTDCQEVQTTFAVLHQCQHCSYITYNETEYKEHMLHEVNQVQMAEIEFQEAINEVDCFSRILEVSGVPHILLIQHLKKKLKFKMTDGIRKIWEGVTDMDKLKQVKDKVFGELNFQEFFTLFLNAVKGSKYELIREGENVITLQVSVLQEKKMKQCNIVVSLKQTLDIEENSKEFLSQLGVFTEELINAKNNKVQQILLKNAKLKIKKEKLMMMQQEMDF